MYMYLYLLYINYFYFSDNISFLSLDTHPLLLRSCITASLYQRYGKMPFPTIKIILLKTLHVCIYNMYSRSEQNEDSSYIETWLWCFYNFNSTAWTCIALWQLTARLSTGRMTSRHYIITRMDGRSTSVPFRCKFRCWMCTHQMNIEECRTQKDNETSVGSQLASKFGEHLLAGWLDVRYH